MCFKFDMSELFGFYNFITIILNFGLPKWLSGKESICQSRRCTFDPWVAKIPWWRKCQSTSLSLPFSARQKNLEGYSPWGCKGLDMTQQLNTQTHIHILNFDFGNAIFRDVERPRFDHLWPTKMATSHSSSKT